VLVLDHADRCGRKVRVSGGGKCNFTNLGATAADYACANPHFVKSALARFTPQDALAFVRRHRLPVVDMGRNMLFSEDANQVAEALLADALAAGARCAFGVRVLGAEPLSENPNARFLVRTERGAFSGQSLVVATGGLAWPQVGATAIGYEIARAFGLGVTPLRPGLAPFTAPPELAAFCADLAGVSLPARIVIADRDARPRKKLPIFAADLLFTHRGISGPVCLDASGFWTPGDVLLIDLLPGADVAAAFAAHRKMALENLLARLLPRRLAQALCALRGWSGTPAALAPKKLAEIEAALHGLPLRPSGTEGHERSEATLGGVDVARISSKTLEARDVPGLYFTGEVLDVTGRLGGYNLQWAWASGFTAGQFA
jgi:predicted Rossmann fold flavoprotein